VSHTATDNDIPEDIRASCRFLLVTSARAGIANVSAHLPRSEILAIVAEFERCVREVSEILDPVRF